MKQRAVIPVLLMVVCGSSLRGADFVFDIPSDDRWHYPFNFTPGDSGTSRVFGSFGNPDFLGFNDRDGVMIVGWDTAPQVEPGLDQELYEVCTVSVRVTNTAGATWPIDVTLDNVSTFRGQPDADPGRPIELFGVAFGPEYSYEIWDEGEIYAGARCNFETRVCQNDPRDPYPFVFRDGFDQLLHVEDSVKGTQNEDVVPPLCPNATCPFTPVPWAIGVPQGYVPGQQSVPFDVHFKVNLALSGGRVGKYFAEQLSGGRVFVYITTLYLAELLGGQSTYPTFWNKEAFGSGAKPAQLVIRLKSDPPGDINGDGLYMPEEFETTTACLRGPGGAINPQPPLAADTCRCALDTDDDGDIDLFDLAEAYAAQSGG